MHFVVQFKANMNKAYFLQHLHFLKKQKIALSNEVQSP